MLALPPFGLALRGPALGRSPLRAPPFSVGRGVERSIPRLLGPFCDGIERTESLPFGLSARCDSLRSLRTPAVGRGIFRSVFERMAGDWLFPGSLRCPWKPRFGCEGLLAMRSEVAVRASFAPGAVTPGRGTKRPLLWASEEPPCGRLSLRPPTTPTRSPPRVSPGLVAPGRGTKRPLLRASD